MTRARSLRDRISPWFPAALATLLVAGLLRRYGTPLPVTAFFLLIVAATTTLPGMLLWRRFRGAPVSLAEDLAVGTAIGLAAQVVLAFLLTPVGGPRWAWLWVVPAVLQSLTPTGRSRCWARQVAGPAPAWSSWVQAAAVVLATVWLGAYGFAHDPVVYVSGHGPWSRGVPTSPYIDLPFQQAMATAMDDGAPLRYPFLPDVTVHYHVLAYEHLAGVADVSGIDLTWLVYRLDPAVMLALTIVLVGALAQRVARRSAAAPVAAVLAVVSAAPSVYTWGATGASGLLASPLMRSPTHGFLLPLLLAALLVIVLVLRSPSGLRTVRTWALLATATLLALAAGGSKSSAPPVLVGAVALATLVAFVVRSAARAAALVLTALIAASAALTLALVTGGDGGTTTVDPLAVLDFFLRTTGTGAQPASRVPALLLCMLTWLAPAAGVLLLRRRRDVLDPVLWLLGGGVAAGLAATLAVSAIGVSELYFLYACWPLLGVLSAWGLTAVSDGLRPVAAIGTAIWGAVCAAVLPFLVRQPAQAGFSARTAVEAWVLWTVAIAVAPLLVALVAVRRRAPFHRAVLAGLCVALVGSSLALRGSQIATSVDDAVAGTAVTPDGPQLPVDAARAALYVRDHAGEDDVVATNAHCFGTGEPCVPQHYWVTALSERRTLLEGWDYPGHPRSTEYWDPAIFALNESAFYSPSATALTRLREDYGVRWLVVDRGVAKESPDLGRLADLVYDEPDAAVYRLP